tara:strand:- start:195 stop:344 length:150 start_codon:yes stop_codon:yes gene_type:complete
MSVAFLRKYEKSIEEGYNDYSLIDYDQVKPEKEDYKVFEDYWNALVIIL